jgi:hypothetical protein
MASQSAIKSVLEPIFRAIFDGQSRSEFGVRFDNDHDGDPSIFIEAKIPVEQAEKLYGLDYWNFRTKISAALRDLEEERFPYFKIDIRHSDATIEEMIIREIAGIKQPKNEP